MTTQNAPRLRSLSTVQARLQVQGPDARRYLHGMVSNDVQGLRPGQGCHACLLSVKGKLVGDLVILDLGEPGLLLCLAAAARQGVLKTLDRHLIMDNATVRDASTELDALQVIGTSAAEALGRALPSLAASDLSSLPRYSFANSAMGSEVLRVLAVPPLDEPTFSVVGPPTAVSTLQQALVADGAQMLDEAQADILRVEAGLPEYGRDLDEDRMPAEAGLDDAVRFDKGCYMGQEVVVRLRDRGHLNRRLCGLRIATDGPLPAAGSKLRSPDRPQAAVLTSVVKSPRFGVIGLAYVHRSVWEPGTQLELLGTADEPTGQLATVVSLPFADGSVA